MRAFFVLTVLGIGLSSGQTVSPSDNHPPVNGLLVQNTIYDPTRQTLAYDLVNMSGKAVVTWVVQEHLQYSNGKEQPGAWGIVDTGGVPKRKEASGAPNPTGFGPLMPNEQRHVQDSYRNKLLDTAPASTQATSNDIVNVKVDVAAVIYDDSTAEGDENIINDLFARRKARSDEYQHWLDRFSALRKSGDPAADAKQLYQDLVDASYQAEKEQTSSMTTAQREARFARQQLQDYARNLIRFAESHRPLETSIAQLENQAAAMVQTSQRQ
ncbi:MAG TPA: hypothetical protein VKU01_18010 [Bryobacteraceae bacterium]|nr:hypothetical protein [Bryobacteraceae bacterium]